MLKDIRIYTSDEVWRQILKDLGATVVDAAGPADINFDGLDVNGPISPMELKSIILDAQDSTEIIKKVLGDNVAMPSMHAKIISLLYKTGGMRAVEIKDALGYSPNAATHTVDTAIYQMRRAYGHDFIVNDNGVYRLGKL